MASSMSFSVVYDALSCPELAKSVLFITKKNLIEKYGTMKAPKLIV